MSGTRALVEKGMRACISIPVERPELPGYLVVFPANHSRAQPGFRLNDGMSMERSETALHVPPNTLVLSTRSGTHGPIPQKNTNPTREPGHEAQDHADQCGCH